MPRKYIRKTDRSSYDNEKLFDAVNAVKNGSISAYAASKLYNIPRTTIVNRVYDRKGLKSKTLGRCTALPTDVEETLAVNLHVMEKSGFGLTRKEVIELVGQYVVENNIKTPFKDGIPGEDWFIAFKIRHGLSVKKPQAVEHARKTACRPALLYSYFDLLEETINELGLRDKPSHIWNCDETSFSKDPSKSNVVGRRGYTSTRTIASPGKTNTTVLLACNAAGDKAPPLIIYTGKNIWNEWVSKDGYPGTVYAATEKGWMEATVFENFFEKVFLPTVENKRPILLLYDGHSTHVGIKIIQKARENNITILKIPPHTSHLLQPLDLAVNKSFKDKWDIALVKWQRLNVGKVLPKKEFSTIIGQVWTQIDPEVCKAGFRKAGIYPINKNVIAEDKFDPALLAEWKNAKQLEKSQNQLVKHISPNKLSDIALTVVNKIHIIQQEVPQSTSNSMDASLKCVLHSKEKGAPLLKNENVQKRPKVQILDNQRVYTNVTFEELLLKMIGPAKPSLTTKRTKIAAGAEVITHDDVYERYQKLEEEKKEKLKKQEEKKASRDKKKPTEKRAIRNNKTGVKTEKNGEERCENRGVDISLPGPSSINKKSKIKSESKKSKTLNSIKKIARRRKKFRKISSSSSTSVSECMSVHEDSDIIDVMDEECDMTRDLYINEFILNYKPYNDEQEDDIFSIDKKNKEVENVGMQNKETITVTEESDETNTVSEEFHGEWDGRAQVEKEYRAFNDQAVTKRNKVIQDVSGILDQKNQGAKEVGERSHQRNNNIMEKEGNDKWDVMENIEEKENYKINDNVLIRYFVRKRWVYYVGYIENILCGSDSSYDINFYKTYKKPLKFKLTKHADRDTVLEYSIVKKVSLSQNPINSKEFLLAEEDHAYFF